MVHVTAFFAGVLALIYIGLAVIVIRGRYAQRLAIGDGGDNVMQHKIRAHANFSEYVPLALVLMGLDELNGSAHVGLSILGIALVAARLSHAYSLIVMEVKNPNMFLFRMGGMIGTFSVIAILALMAIF